MRLPKKISALPGVSTIKNADLFAIVQDGVTSNVTFAILESIISGSTASADTYVTGGVYNSGTSTIDFTGNTDFPPFSVNVSALTGTTGDDIWTTGATITSIRTFGNVSSGFYSVAEGLDTSALGDGSHAEGESAVASGNYSHAEGTGCYATSGASHAEGNQTTASGDYSHTQGKLTTASGAGAHAGGVNSIASGLMSFIHSSGSTITGSRSAVLGGSNITGTTDDTVYVPNLNIGTVGGGTPINNLGIDSIGNVVDSGVSIQEAKLVILSGDVLQLFTTPQQIIAAPGAGKTIDVISCMGTLNFATTAYTHSAGSSKLGLQFLGSSAQTMSYPSVTGKLLHSTVTRTLKMQPSVFTGGAGDHTQVLENTPLNVSVSIGNPADGDSDITIYVTYRILTL